MLTRTVEIFMGSITRASRLCDGRMIGLAGAFACSMSASAAGPGFSYIALDRHLVQTTYQMISSSAAGLFNEAFPPDSSSGALQHTFIGKTRIEGQLIAEPFSVQNSNGSGHGLANSELHATFELFEPTQVAILAHVTGTTQYDGGDQGPDASFTLSPQGDFPVFTTPFDPGAPQQTLFTFNQMLDPGQWSLDVRASGAFDASIVGTFFSDAQIEFQMMKIISAPPILAHFDPATNFGAGVSPVSVVAADFNNDGDTDLATANYSNNRILTILNNGFGSFLPTNISITGHHPNLLTTADFNGDGDADLAVTTGAATGEVSAFLNNGSGFFTPAATSIIGHFLRSIASADFDNDGDIDLVVATSKTIYILFNNGSGNFAPPVDLANVGLSGLVKSVTVADFDGDGDIDLAAINNNSVSVLFNDGVGGFAPAVGFDVSGQPLFITAADFDGDGDTDLAVTRFGKVSALLNNGAGDFSTVVSYTGVLATSMTAADFDGDGDIDLAMSSAVSGANGSVSVLINDGLGHFTAATNTLPVQGAPQVVSANLNHDALPDLVTANVSSSTISVLLNQTVVIGDINGDGVVNGSDLASLLMQWGLCPPLPTSCFTDLNSDGIVNAADLATLLANWIVP